VFSRVLFAFFRIHAYRDHADGVVAQRVHLVTFVLTRPKVLQKVAWARSKERENYNLYKPTWKEKHCKFRFLRFIGENIFVFLFQIVPERCLLCYYSLILTVRSVPIISTEISKNVFAMWKTVCSYSFFRYP